MSQTAIWTFTSAGEGIETIEFGFVGRRLFGRWWVRGLGRFRTFDEATAAVRREATRREREIRTNGSGRRQKYANE